MSEKLKIVYRPLQELSPYAHNARTHSTEQVAQLVESIKQFGWTNPVLIDEKGEIIAGHGRVMAAEMLKMDSVPVIVLSGLTDEQKKACQRQDYWPFFAIFNVRYWSLMLSAFRHFIITDWRGVFCQHSRFAFFL
ncbi:Rac prophage protein [Escherichia coli]|nr:Rac prophage protein [Escherichia coli]